MSTIRKSQKFFTSAAVGGKKPRAGRRRGTPPVVHPNELPPNIVYARTGYKDINALLTFVIIVSNGDIDKMTTKISRLTWFEEWFVFFELMHAKTLNSFTAAAAVFKIKNDIIANIFNEKLRQVLEARRSWPKYASLHEDNTLKSDKWKEKYKGKRVIFHDNTGIKISQPQDGFLQRLTYSSYYGGNVGKAGVHVQQCGWIGAYEIFPGAISDTDYLDQSLILDEQKVFQENDGGVPFYNILDRGYRSTQAAWRRGQFVLQPTFVKSDRKFNTEETIQSSRIAADRSGNERAVRLCKTCNFLRNAEKGFKMKEVNRLCDVWLAHSFQINFMYKSVM